MRAFLLLFLLFPVLELYVFFKVSTAIGFFPALLLIIAGSVLGVLVMRVAGLATVLRTRASLQRGELPAEQMFNGLVTAMGGVLLIVPGFITDVFGVLCLLPFTRHFLIRKVRERAQAQAMRQRAFADDMPPPGGSTQAYRAHVIEGEVIEGEVVGRETGRTDR
ncbi:FxsA family protein [Pseudomonas coleopterorum]|jgi:UPF0716 protein FxsA|uniref:Membrane protein FxsA n=1 Tax=Pseudomonas coleopterorum TaxID=1605838 RepID=A0ABR9BTE5_9PSED|nr:MULTISPECIES: FxsA family protein [Pseudomonas]KNC14448.1 exclusion suppressor FxsA [Pseudomonas sp. RIT-PI-a]MBD8480968.1 membrane protein FxsA [Pseudomonas coleopterorum]MBD8754839.1 membrane protein FxsA [Pseudomonas coleopterorum]MBD8768165.1 membrane protein FxsA [Pseudomonas coleopterorum]MDY1018094.1 FxsA family protein [Pseudomonas coleopterorum]